MSYLVSEGWSRIARQCALSLMGFAVALFAVSVTGVHQARADDLPFWEQADAKKKSSKKSYSSTKSKKSYASAKKKSYASAATSKKKLGGYAEATEPKKYKKKGVRVASLDGGAYSSGGGSLTGGGGKIHWTANAGCLDSGLRSVLAGASAYGSITVNSTCRSHSHNAAVGGAPRSKHLTGDAVDFRVHGNIGAVYAYLKSSGSVGGLKHYGGGLFHIDNGERRSW